MITYKIENDIFQNAIAALKDIITLDITIEPTEHIPNRPFKADRLLRIIYHDTEMHFHAEIKANITKTDALIHHAPLGMGMLPYKLLLVTRYVNPKIADMLKQKGTQFIDTAGNAYINNPPLYIYVKGNQMPEILRPIPQKRAFKPTGLKLIFTFLCNPGLENKPYREIATVANVALGTVGWIMRDLKEMGYMINMGTRGNKLIEKEKLFERWITEYPEKLRPKLLLGRFKGNPYWWQKQMIRPDDAQWGGEVAAEKITHYLKAELATIYIAPAMMNQILMEHRLRKDPGGETEMLERFWTPTGNQLNNNTVHPLLIYADLLGTGNERNIETAKMIYEQHIIQLIRED